MSPVALDDIPACQHIIRILMGRKDLRIKEIRIQYTISKVVSHGACLDVLAEDETGQLVDDGVHIMFVNAQIDDSSEIAGLMKYFKTSDPEDMSQGALSERIQFLKGEKGEKDMCEY